MSADDQEIANTARRSLLDRFGQPKDGGFKNAGCSEDPEDLCWVPYLNTVAYSNGVLYLLMDTDWTQQPDGARNVKAQNVVARLFGNGAGPRLVMDNVKTIQSVDRNGVVRSDAPLE